MVRAEKSLYTAQPNKKKISVYTYLPFTLILHFIKSLNLIVYSLKVYKCIYIYVLLLKLVLRPKFPFDPNFSTLLHFKRLRLLNQSLNLFLALHLSLHFIHFKRFRLLNQSLSKLHLSNG